MELIGTMFEDDLTKKHIFKYSVILSIRLKIHVNAIKQKI